MSNKFKFDQHLLELSESTEIEPAKQEWVKICNHTREDNDQLCICQHYIKHVTYLYNEKTHHVITVGTGCATKFKMREDKMKEDIFQQILKEVLSKGDYGSIDNLVEYSQVVYQQLVDHFEKEMETGTLDQLEKLSVELEEVITRHKLVHLQEILSRLIVKRDQLRAEEDEKKQRQLERERLQQLERKRTQQLERERMQRERDNWKEENENRRQEHTSRQLEQTRQERLQKERTSIELERKRLQKEQQSTKKPNLVNFQGLEIPEEWLSTQPLYLEYIAEITPMQRKALQIAMIHLKTSFDLARSNGFVEWLAKRVAPSSESR
jgi:hypothetical protein